MAKNFLCIIFFKKLPFNQNIQVLVYQKIHWKCDKTKEHCTASCYSNDEIYMGFEK